MRLQGEKPKERSEMNNVMVESCVCQASLGFSFMRAFLCEVSKKEREKRGERVRVCACESK